MTPITITDLISAGEGMTSEFKECRSTLNRNVFETLCAFLNTEGGTILLGVAENANLPHGHGAINPASFSPFPKNPIIARFFKEIRLADELGSGVRNLFKYVKIYSRGGDPRLMEEDIFRADIPIPHGDGGINEGISEGLKSGNHKGFDLAGREAGGLNGGLNGGFNEVLKIVTEAPGIQTKEISVALPHVSRRTIERQIRVLADKGLIERRGSRKTGGYFRRRDQ